MAAKGREAYTYFKYTGREPFRLPNPRSTKLDILIAPNHNYGLRKSGKGNDLRLCLPESNVELPLAITITNDNAQRLISASKVYQSGYIARSHNPRHDPVADEYNLLVL